MMEQWLVVSGIYELCSLTQSRLSHSLLYGGGNQLEDGDGEDDDDNDDIMMITTIILNLSLKTKFISLLTI